MITLSPDRLPVACSFARYKLVLLCYVHVKRVRDYKRERVKTDSLPYLVTVPTVNRVNQWSVHSLEQWIPVS